MTMFRSRFLSSLIALCVLAAPAHAAEPYDNSGGSFTPPGYSPLLNPQGAQGQNLPSGQSRYPGAQSSRNPLISNTPWADGNQRLNDYSIRREPRPEPKPSEFQKFVEVATGRLLPIFGSAFFSDAADAFDPVDNIPVSADYTVAPVTRSS